jgi:hypothetical protein
MPLLDLFLTVMWFFLFVAWIWLVVWVIIDIVRSDDLSGWAKALWALLVIVIPWLGVLAYLIAHGKPMAERGRHWAFNEPRPSRHHEGTITVVSTADELAKLSQLRTDGVIDDEEFAAQKARLLAGP